jgi:iron uptake system component EfeO
VERTQRCGRAPVADKLAADVGRLPKLAAGLHYQPAELANGAVGLLDEVSKSKVTGEEERYSHFDLLDFQANVEGSEQAFANLQPGLAKIDSTLTGTISARFAALIRCSTSTGTTTSRRASCCTRR